MVDEPKTGAPRAIPAHALALAAFCRRRDIDLERGLDEAEAARRLQSVGPNRVPEWKVASRWGMAARQLTSPLVALLAGAAALSLAIGEGLDAIVIGAIVVANAVLGYLQENRAERAAEELRNLLSPRAKVIREGRQLEVAAEVLVPGDVIRLRQGDRVPADTRLAKAESVEADESALTGESLPVAKQVDPPAPVEAPIAERPTILFAGTIVSRGSASAVVVATGERTEVGRTVAEAGRTARPPTPLQTRVARFSALLLRAGGLLCAGVAALALIQGETLIQSLRIGVSLAVAAVPEGLPAVLTLSLAIGVQRMSRRGAIIRRLAAVETLGSTTVICTDKTGTLTEGSMTVQRLHPLADGSPPDAPDGDARLLGAALLASQPESGPIRSPGGLGGGPTETAVVAAAAQRDVAPAEGRVIAVQPFDSSRKRMSVVVEDPAGVARSYVKGAPEVLLPRLRASRETLAKLEQTAARWADEGTRVLLVASRELGAGENPEHDLEPVGLIGLADPPRATAAASVREARSAGVRTVMITGDHPGTALAIARTTGIAGREAAVLTGADLDRLSDEELTLRVATVDVYARVTPVHKLRIVNALRAGGAVVAMTGDGVNDVPALRAAEVGVAMGQRGTDAAKAAADVVVGDDDYSTIVEAVRRGRGVYDNVLRFVQFLLAANAGEVLVFVVAIAAGFSAPLTVIQVLLVNLLTDGPPAVAMGLDPPAADVMRRRPRPREQGMLEPIIDILLVGGIVTGMAAFAAFLVGDADMAKVGQTMAFTTLVFGQLALIFAIRRKSWRSPGARNPTLIVAVAACAAAQAAILSIPALRSAFDVATLEPAQVFASLALAALPAVAVLGFKSWRDAGD